MRLQCSQRASESFSGWERYRFRETDVSLYTIGRLKSVQMCVMKLRSAGPGKGSVAVAVVMTVGVFLVMRPPRAALPHVTLSFPQPPAPSHNNVSSHCRALFTVPKEGSSNHQWESGKYTVL